MSFSSKTRITVARQGHLRKARKVSASSGIIWRCHWVYPTLLIAVMVAFVIMYLCQSAHQISIQYEVNELKIKKFELVKEQRELKLAIENLGSLERVERIAKEEMSMSIPTQRLVLDLSQPGSVASIEEVSLASP